MKTLLLNPAIKGEELFIREGRCMQKTSSWATIWPPITLALLGSLARAYGEVTLFDGNVEKKSRQELLDFVVQFAPDVIVVNTGFPSIDKDMALAKALKEHVPGIKLIAYGLFFTLLEEKSLSSYPFLDFALIGEPEATFQELMALIVSGSRDYGQVQGLAFTSDGGVTVNEARPLIDNLDTLPFPARDLLRNDRYRLPHNNKPFSLVDSSRGCPYACTYCIVKPYYGGRVRHHSIGYIIDEIKECHNRYGISEFLFREEVFTLDKKFVSDLCDELLRSGLKIKWAATTRVDTLDEATLLKMKAAGCYLLGLGIESGCQEILDNVRKNQTLEQTTRAVEMCKRVKLQTMGHFIFGLPGETRETAQRTIDYMLGLGLDYMQAYSAVPYPKTEFGDSFREKGWVLTDSWTRYDLGGDSIVSTDTMSAADITCFRQKAFRCFYFRPGYILKTALKELSFPLLFRMLNFLDWIKIRK